MTSKDWKSNLLSSSIPLESEVANILVDHNFVVSSDYPYIRRDSTASGIQKEFSIDLKAMKLSTSDLKATNLFSSTWENTQPLPRTINSSISLLIECKYRFKHHNWLFVTEPNHPTFANSLHYETFRIIDEFSPYSIDRYNSIQFDSQFLTCYKGTEVDTQGGAVHDNEIRKGISQLRYSLPRFLKDSILQNAIGDQKNNQPFIFIPILLTTSDLYVTNPNFSINAVESADKIEDIATKVDSLLLFSEYGPEFEVHCFDAFKQLEGIRNMAWFKEFALRQTLRPVTLPSTLLLNALISPENTARTLVMNSYFSKFLVCSLSGFENLLTKITNVFDTLLENTSLL